jgi:hypothetical protein
MYCPRCGSQNTDTTKFCRQCGLPLAQVMDYVSTGGTGALAKPPYSPPPPPLIETSEMLALKHKRVLMTLSVCIAPVIFAILSDEVFKASDIAGIPFLLIPIGIVWVRFHYRMQLRRLQERQLQEYYAHQQYQQSMPQQAMPQQAMPQQAMPQQAPAPKLIIQMPSNQAPVGQPQFDAPRTNPLAEPSHGSVIEDETRKFPER